MVFNGPPADTELSAVIKLHHTAQYGWEMRALIPRKMETQAQIERCNDGRSFIAT